MGKHDEALIAEAKKQHPADWPYVALHLMPQAESAEAIAELRRIANWLYHRDEYGVRAL